MPSLWTSGSGFRLLINGHSMSDGTCRANPPLAIPN